MFSTCFRQALARYAIAPVLVNIRVVCRVLVTTRAMSLVLVIVANLIAVGAAVLFGSHSAEMVRIHATPSSADVVENQIGRNRSVEQLVAKSMRFIVLGFDNELPVAALVHASRPQPAAVRAILVDLGPEFTLGIPRIAQALPGTESGCAAIRYEIHSARLANRHDEHFTASVNTKAA